MAVVAAWRGTGSSRTTKERGLQLLAAPSQCSNLGWKSLCALQSLAVAELQEGIVFPDAY